MLFWLYPDSRGLYFQIYHLVWPITLVIFLSCFFFNVSYFKSVYFSVAHKPLLSEVYKEYIIWYQEGNYSLWMSVETFLWIGKMLSAFFLLFVILSELWTYLLSSFSRLVREYRASSIHTVIQKFIVDISSLWDLLLKTHSELFYF